MARYVALVDRSSEGAYGVVFPDAPGATAMGDTVDEALVNAAEALAEWASDELARGRSAPGPRTLEELLKDTEVAAAIANEGAVPTFVPLVLNSGQPTRANISVDAGLLNAIDEAAKRNGLTRSAFLASAAREKIAGGR